MRLWYDVCRKQPKMFTFSDKDIADSVERQERSKRYKLLDLANAQSQPKKATSSEEDAADST